MLSWSFWGSPGRFCTSCPDDAGAVENERHPSRAHRAHPLGGPPREGLPPQGCRMSNFPHHADRPAMQVMTALMALGQKHPAARQDIEDILFSTPELRGLMQRKLPI